MVIQYSGDSRPAISSGHANSACCVNSLIAPTIRFCSSQLKVSDIFATITGPRLPIVGLGLLLTKARTRLFGAELSFVSSPADRVTCKGTVAITIGNMQVTNEVRIAPAPDYLLW